MAAMVDDGTDETVRSPGLDAATDQTLAAPAPTPLGNPAVSQLAATRPMAPSTVATPTGVILETTRYTL